jgi:hypothetical protein
MGCQAEDILIEVQDLEGTKQLTMSDNHGCVVWVV